ncbi:MAG: SpoIIE family protein phosphatase [Nitrospirota bacterium]
MTSGTSGKRSLLHRVWARQDWKVGTKLIVLTVPLIALLSMVAAVVEHARITADLREKLSTRAKSITRQIMADRQYYASVIVPRAKEMGATFGPDYKEAHGRFPLPATFVREVSEQTAKARNGFTANLISPWAINKEKGVRDQFQQDGFAYLLQHPDQPFIRSDTVEGRAVLRVLSADLASAQSCVTCHNGHPDSPKHDFKLNDVMGGLEITMPMDKYLEESDLDLMLTLAGGGVMCALVFAIVAVGSRRTVTQPLRALEGKMQAFVGERPYLSGRAAGHRSGDEVVHITEAFEQMKAVIESQQQELRNANQLLEQRVVERTEQLRQTMEEKERIGSELRIASDIQRSILPRTFPPFPDREDFGLYAETIPAREMGGDFYDFFLIDEDRLGLVIADVSGKGVPAAIFMAVSRTMLKATAMQGVDPGECLRKVNNLLCPDNDSAMFVTVFYGILNTRTGELEYANAGHNVPYVLSGLGSVALLENPGGMALGVFPDNDYPVRRVRMRGSEGLLLYTDGVTEAMDGNGNLFTDARLKQLLLRIQGGTPREIVEDVIAEVRSHAAGELQADDITLLALRYLRG